MKTVLISVVACACLVFASVASASDLAISAAMRADFNYVRGLCRHDNQCLNFGVLKCKRRSSRRVDCIDFTLEKDRAGKYTCKLGHSWTAKDGRLWVASTRSPHCVDGWRY